MQVDTHPAARIRRGILVDHATGVVIGETAVIGDNVSMLHHVTLGGSGTGQGVRHPTIGGFWLVILSDVCKQHHLLGNVPLPCSQHHHARGVEGCYMSVKIICEMHHDLQLDQTHTCWLLCSSSPCIERFLSQ